MRRSAWVLALWIASSCGCDPSPPSSEPQISKEPGAAPTGVHSAAPPPAPTGAPTASATAAPPPPAPPPPAPTFIPISPTQTVALWVREKKPGAKKPVDSTRLLRADGTSSSQNGILVIVGDALYRFKNREKTSAGESCDGFGQNPYPVRKLQSAELTPVGDGKSIPLLDFARPDPDKEVSLPAREERELVAVAPGYLFIKTSTITSSCGAHPMYENEFSLFAVRPNATKELVPESDFAEGAQAKLEQAVQKLNANLDPSTPPESLDSAVEGEQVTVSMAYPTFRTSGPSWTLLYTASATWAGSYGGWSGYTRSVAIELDVAPRRFRDAITMPEVVRAHIAAHPDEEALGFTVGDIQPPR